MQWPARARQRVQSTGKELPIIRLAAIAVLVMGVAASSSTRGTPSDEGLKEPFVSRGALRSSASDEAVWVEACDGSRKRVSEAETSGCEQWTVEWRRDGEVWGVSSAASMSDVVAQRDRTLGFVRYDARFFGKVDRLHGDPGPPICDVCDASEAASGLFGVGQRFGPSESQRALKAIAPRVEGLEKALFGEHLPRVRRLARLAHDSKTARATKQYVGHIRAALVALAQAKLSLDDAAMLRSRAPIVRAQKLIAGRAKALQRDFVAVQAAVARELRRAYAGRYVQEGPNAENKALQLDFDGAQVTARYLQGTATSVWFEGAIGLDGSITGHSLVTPKHEALRCSDHTEACGFERVRAVLRFSERESGPENQRHAVELWFQQGEWVRAPIFSR